MLLNDRTPVEEFDVTGEFDFSDRLRPLEELRRTAMDNRPDLKAAVEAVDKAQTDHRLAIANGSVDPTFSVDVARNPPIPAYIGVSVNFPLRIFDRNQGEKLKTQEDITRNERLRDAATAQVFSDVDSAYATMESNRTLLRPYKDIYLKEAVEVRDTVSFAYTRGGGVSARFSASAAGLSQHRAKLLEFGGLIPDRFRATEHGGGAGGHSMKHPMFIRLAPLTDVRGSVEINRSLWSRLSMDGPAKAQHAEARPEGVVFSQPPFWPRVWRWPAAAKRWKPIPRWARRRRPRLSTNRMAAFSAWIIPTNSLSPPRASMTQRLS